MNFKRYFHSAYDSIRLPDKNLKILKMGCHIFKYFISWLALLRAIFMKFGNVLNLPQRDLSFCIVTLLLYLYFLPLAYAGNPPVGGGGSCDRSLASDGSVGQQQAYNNGLYTCLGSSTWGAGALILGSVLQDGSSPTCNATNAGMLKYSSGVVQLCNGASWGNVGASVSGSDTQVMFNDGGVTAGNTNLTFTKATSTLMVGAASGAVLTVGASGASTSKISLGPTTGAAAPNSNIGATTVATSQTTASTSFTDLATVGPAVTLTTGPTAIVTVTAKMSNGTAANECNMGFAVSGATTVAASSAQAILATSSTGGHAYQMSGTFYVTGLTGGSNTFTAKYAAVTGGTCTFLSRHIVVTLP